jgi:hypothetical protein
MGKVAFQLTINSNCPTRAKSLRAMGLFYQYFSRESCPDFRLLGLAMSVLLFQHLSIVNLHSLK